MSLWHTPSCLGYLWSDLILPMPRPLFVHTNGAAWTKRFQGDRYYFLTERQRLRYRICWWWMQVERGRMVFRSQCCHILCCGCGHTVNRCDYPDGSCHIPKQKLGIYHLSEVRSAMRQSIYVLRRTVRSSTMDVSLSAICPILVFKAAVNDWRF